MLRSPRTASLEPTPARRPEPKSSDDTHSLDPRKPVLGNHGDAELRTRTLVRQVIQGGHTVLRAQQQASTVHTELPGLRRLDLPFRQDRLRYAENLRSRRPLSAQAMRSQAWRRARAAVSDFDPQLCIVSELVSYDSAKRLMPRGCPWIYDAHNVEPELFADLGPMEPNPIRRVAYAVDAKRFARDEALVLAQAKAVAVVSASDLTLLRARHPEFTAVLVPNSVPQPTAADPCIALPTVLFVGMLSYPPSIEAIGLLLEEIMPAVRERVPDARLMVVGRDPGPRLRRELAGRPWCDLHQNVPDLAPFYSQARCVAIPLRTGSGTRLKTYEAMSYGLPVVGSSVAFEGIAVSDGETGLFANTSAEFVEGVVHLLSDLQFAGRIGSNSRELFRRELAADTAAAPLLELIDAITADRALVGAR